MDIHYRRVGPLDGVHHFYAFDGEQEIGYLLLNKNEVYSSGITIEKYKGKGIGKKMYEMALIAHGTIMSDNLVSFGARMVYESLGKFHTLKVNDTIGDLYNGSLVCANGPCFTLTLKEDDAT